MGSRHSRTGARLAVLAGIVAAGFGMAIPAQADPLWPGGPDIPGVPPLIPSPIAPVIAPCSAETRLCLRLSTNEMWLMEDGGKVVYGPDVMSHGRPGYETPPGTFRVAFKREDHWSTLHHVPMKWAVFFNGDIATHIGPTEEQSHGCIRMTPVGAERTFYHLSPGDIVQVVN
ncbi:L,D-transpeptidase [Nocardia sp. 2]|uniref:L,D-transpeptidase n=1 Tax=Nocardia acididurans TaxID=2802282 RepID=A0ABS1MFP5_9NOCA|nr:L,D-transpeptidase [Nocardia acididurans]MBL1079376.1 L,D-transpeptidase [Nocardia acididurans]